MIPREAVGIGYLALLVGHVALSIHFRRGDAVVSAKKCLIHFVTGIKTSLQ
jgi:hypothetical protein